MMKKLLIILISLLLLLSGCATAPKETHYQEPMGDITFGGIHTFIYSVEGYDKHIETYKDELPETFVHLDNLPDFGKLTFFCVSQSSDCVYTWKNIRTNQDLYLTISQETKRDQKVIVIDNMEFHRVDAEKDMASMLRKQPSETKTVIACDNIDYFYSHTGKLISIAWYIDGLRYYYYCVDFAKNKDPFINKLLSADKAEQQTALVEFEQLLSTK